MEIAKYQQIDAVNWSTLRYLDRSPRHYLHAKNTKREDTPAMRLGRAVHCAVLEPERFKADYLVWSGGIRRGKAWDEFLEAAGDKETLSLSEAEECQAISDAVRFDPDAAALLSGGSAEHPLFWTDAETGLHCKSRLDYLGPDARFVVDLKTTRNAHPRAFGRSAGDSLYYGQLAFYAEGVLATTGRLPMLHLVAVENEAPYVTQVYTLSDDDVEVGRAKVRELLRRLAECRSTDTWPGYATGPLPLWLPSWITGDGSGGTDLSDLGLEVGA